MKKLVCVSVGMLVLSAGNAYAALCNGFGGADNSTPGGVKKLTEVCTVNTVYGDSHCATLDYYDTFVTQYDDGTCKYLESCATCPDGYKLSEDLTFTVGDVCYAGDTVINVYNQDDLDEMWLDYHVCEKIIEQKYCATGFYGTTSDGTTGCAQCPTWSGVYTNSSKTTLARGTSTSGENTVIVDCYISYGTYYDATGEFELKGTCYYKK